MAVKSSGTTRVGAGDSSIWPVVYLELANWELGVTSGPQREVQTILSHPKQENI